MEETINNAEEELKLLKERATLLGIKFSNNRVCNSKDFSSPSLLSRIH